jgi:hypothetical protein
MAHQITDLTPTAVPGMYVVDDGELDHITERGPDGLRRMRPIAATAEEKVAAEAAALRRELDGVEHRLFHLDDPLPPLVTEPPSEQALERTRTSLVNTKAAILARLAELEPPARKGKR